MSSSKKLSISKIKKLLSLFKFIVSQKSNNKANALSFLNSSSIDDISESIYNIQSTLVIVYLRIVEKLVLVDFFKLPKPK